MSHLSKSAVTPLDVIRILRDHPRRWIVPTVIITVAAAAYGVMHAPLWDATQALMVRDEAMGAARPGKFQQPDEMKTVQETILELARSHAVLAAALAEVGPERASENTPNWPDNAAIGALQGHMKLVPPKGAEFGKTEVFYLNVEANSRTRAVALAAAICKHLQERSQELRDQKAQSLIAELSKTASLAKADLTTSTSELTSIETRVGADLGELRLLNETAGGDSPLHRSINEMDQELRQAKQAIDGNKELLSLLNAAKSDARSLAAAPNRLLEAQPVLRRLKDGLVDAQLRTAQLSGNLTANHPTLMAAKTGEEEISEQVRREIDASLLGVQAELRLSQERADLLESQLANAHQRLGNLAKMRAEYANHVAERNQRADILKAAEQQLGEARASQAAANTASLIAAIDAPVAGDAPVGPGKSTILAGGLLGGMILGLGIVFLTVQPAQTDVVPEVATPVVESIEKATPRFAGRVNGHILNGYGLSLKQALRKVAMAG